AAQCKGSHPSSCSSGAASLAMARPLASRCASAPSNQAFGRSSASALLRTKRATWDLGLPTEAARPSILSANSAPSRIVIMRVIVRSCDSLSCFHYPPANRSISSRGCIYFPHAIAGAQLCRGGRREYRGPPLVIGTIGSISDLGERRVLWRYAAYWRGPGVGY